MNLVRSILNLYLLNFKILFSGQYKKKTVYEQVAKITLGSLPIVSIATTFTGIVVTHEIAWHMDVALQTVSLIPGFSGQFILRELGVIIPAFLVVAKVGASITAEIGSMKVTDQINALKLLRIDPISYLVFPRWVATIFAMILLTLVGVVLTLTFATILATLQYNFNALEYITSVRKFVSATDLAQTLTKAIVFGSIIPLIGCHYGFLCRRGAQGVGKATTNAVVSSTLIVILLDFTLTYLFTSR